jgi:uncharacterized protein YciI
MMWFAGVTLSLALTAADAVRAPASLEAAPEGTTCYFGMMVKGDGWTPVDSPELAELQRQHLAYRRRLRETGRLLINGPLLDDGRIRGVGIYKATSLEEARAWAEADPAVKAGRLKVEMHPFAWLIGRIER